MNLHLFSSKPRGSIPNLVSLQDPALNDILPTVLVAPLQSDATPTALRPVIESNGHRLVVLCDLVRPIRGTGLRSMGILDERTSSEILEAFRMLLPR